MIKALILVIACFLLVSCTTTESSSETIGIKIQLQNRVQTAVIGQTLEFQVEDFPVEANAYPRIFFEGSFTTAAGQRLEVQTILPAKYDLRGTEDKPETWLIVPRLGAFFNPFTRSAHHGVFEGTIAPILELSDGQIINGNQVPYTLDIKPSLSFMKLEPMHADCGSPALRLLPSMPYRMLVGVSGIAATKFVYEISNINGVDGAYPPIVHEYDQPTDFDILGQSEPLVFNRIPEDSRMAIISIRVKAYDQNGVMVENALPMSLHRPMEVQYDGKYELSQLFEPVPASSCIAGGPQTSVSYSESTSETKQNAVSMNISNTWSNENAIVNFQSNSQGISIGESVSTSQSTSMATERETSNAWGLGYNNSESNSVSFESANGSSWSSNVSQGQSSDSFNSEFEKQFGSENTTITVDNSWEISIPFIAKVGSKNIVSNGITEGHSTGVSSGQTTGTSTDKSYTMGSSTEQGTSFGTVTSHGQSSSLSGSYALASTQEVTQSESMGKQIDKTWNISEGVEFENAQTEAGARSLNETIVSSQTLETTASISGSIPTGQYGMFYRQTSRWVREAEVVTFDLCGKANYMGSIYFNEWKWSVELANASTCPPKSTLPQASCLIEPCE